ncbi:MAG: acetylxylan esterase, partial [Aureliella sp.]
MMASPGLVSRWFFLCLAACGMVSLAAPLPAQSDPQQAAAQAGWKGYLQRRTEELSERSRQKLETITPESWPAESRQWREELQEMLGLRPLPERGDLKANVAGRSEHEGYSVARVSFESRPGLIVTANLYEPLAEAPADGWPAVLYVCGHANVRDEGRLLGNKTGYQHHGIWFARHNVVCLIIDTIQLGELHGEHHGTYKLGRWDWMTRGYTPAGVETWNAIRAIDFLESLPTVDEQRIGITGRSGGGAYSWFAAALDERIRAAVPVAGITDLRNHVIDGCVEGHCDCMYFVNYFGWDYNRLAALVAPRALLLSNSDTDGIFPLDGVMRIHGDLARTYKRLGAANKLGLLLTPGPHQDTQELQVGAFRWLLFHLTGKPVVVDQAATKELEPSELQVFPHETPRDERVSSVGNWFVPTAERVDSARDAASAWQAEWAPELKRLWLAQASAAEGSHSQAFELSSEGKVARLAWQCFRGADESGWNSSVIVCSPADADQDKPAVVHIGTLLGVALGKDSIERELQGQGRLRTAIDAQPERRHVFLCPRSEELFSYELPVRELTQIHRRFYLLGDSAERLAIDDIGRQLRWLGQQEHWPCRRIELVGHGRWAPLAVLVALMSKSDSTAASGAADQAKAAHAQPEITGCAVIDAPQSLLAAPTLLGLNRVTTFDNLLRAAEGTFGSATTVARPGKEARLLVDPAGQPQQASGLRIVEVGDQQATIWCRATLWPLPNLGDLPEVGFADDPKINIRERREPILPP